MKAHLFYTILNIKSYTQENDLIDYWLGNLSFDTWLDKNDYTPSPDCGYDWDFIEGEIEDHTGIIYTFTKYHHALEIKVGVNSHFYRTE